MGWLEASVELDASSAATIARAMREVAQADGLAHPREMALIAQFEAELPEGATPAGQLDADGVDVLLRSVIMVALADGRISEAEEVAIAAIGAEHGVDADRLASLVDEVKVDFLDFFAGRSSFRASVLLVAKELGLEPHRLAALRGEA